MDPILTNKLLGIPYAGAGTTLERNGLMGVMREMIKANKYTAEYILDYCQSVGYPSKMAFDIFTEMTGINPKVIINNNEYYQNPVFVPSMTLGWGYKKGTKTEAYYVVPFEYGYSVMYKNETDVPESKFEYITINDAIDKLKTLVTKVFTINKIINDNCLKYEDVQLNANSVHQTNNIYFSSPINEIKQAYINKAIDDSEFEKKAFRLVAEEKVDVKDAEDAMKWLDELKKEQKEEEFEDIEFGNLKNDKTMEMQEESKQLSGSVQFDEIIDELYTTIGDEYADKNKLRLLYLKNKSFFNDLNKEEAAQKLYELYLGFSQEDIKNKDKYVKKNKIDSSLKIKAKNWVVRLEMTKEMNDLEKWIDENGEFDAESDTPEEFTNLVEKFCDKLFTYKDEIEEKTSEDAASEFDDIVTELKYDGPNSVDNFNYILDNLYDFCDYNSIWLETHGRIEAFLKRKAVDKTAEEIINNFRPEIQNYDKESNFEFINYSFLIKDKNSDFTAVLDVWKNSDEDYNDELHFAWNQDIFDMTNSKDVLQKQVQDDEEVFEYCKEIVESFIYRNKLFKIEAFLKRKAADADIELDDIEEKDVIKDKIEEINNTDFDELTKEETPQDYLEDESKNEQVIKINEKVIKIIDEFTSKFDDFTKYKLQMSSYKLQILNQGTDNDGLQAIEDTELNAQAILQIILTIAPTEDLENAKKALAIFSINKDKVLFSGTLRTADGFVALSEEGLDTIFEEDKKEVEITEDLI